MILLIVKAIFSNMFSGHAQCKEKLEVRVRKDRNEGQSGFLILILGL